MRGVANGRPQACTGAVPPPPLVLRALPMGTRALLAWPLHKSLILHSRARTFRFRPVSTRNAMSQTLLDRIKQTLTAIAEPGRAAPMRAYMRNQFVFLGIPTPVRRKALRPLFRQLKGGGAVQLMALAKQLWALPEREYQYAALDLLASRHKELGIQDIPALLSLAQDKSWWDTVDGLASIIGDILAGSHEGMDAALISPNMWLRRIAMLHQLGWRENTDTARLFSYARTLAPEQEFFIQKAIGWALRDYAHHHPQAVRNFLRAEKDRLAPLSYREANKHIRAG